MTSRERADQLLAEAPDIAEDMRKADAAPLLGEALRGRGLQAEAAFLEWLNETSARLAEIRAPAFYHEIEVVEAEARVAAAAADRVLAFGQDLLGRLRRVG